MGWLGEWLLSPGFGGATAVVAAVIAGLIARGNRRSEAAQSRADRDAENTRAREARWWEQARWAAALTVEPDERSVALGNAALSALITDAPVGVEAVQFAQEALEMAAEQALPPMDEAGGEEHTGVTGTGPTAPRRGGPP